LYPVQCHGEMFYNSTAVIST